MASGSADRAKKKAAEARVEAESAEKRRKRLTNIAIFGVLGLVVLGLVGGAWKASQSNKEKTQPSVEAAVPKGVYPASDADYKYGIPLAKAEGKPVLEVWEDMQCPACKSFEQQFGSTVAALAKNGDATVIWRSTSFLDNKIPGDNSKRAAAAWGCAVDAGKAEEFHAVVFANQPEEGGGFTDELLTAFGEQAGITGEAKATFDACVKDRTYLQWAVNGTQTMAEDGVSSTPGVFLNGEEVTQEQRATPEALKQTVLDAAKAQQK